MWGRVAAGAAMLLVTGCTTAGSGGPLEPATQVDQAAVPACPPRDTPAAYPAGRLPAGATSVRLCDGPLRTSKAGEVLAPGFAAPADALVSHVDRAIEAANGLAPFAPKPDAFCGGVGEDARVYWFTYPDGTQHALTAGDQPCGVLDLGADDHREDASAFEEAFSDLLVDQRDETEAPGAADEAPVCSPDVRPLTRLPLDRLTLERAVLCVRVAPYDRISYRPAELTPSLVARLDEEYDAAEGSPERCAAPSTELLKILAVSEWGDPVELLSSGCGLWSRPGEDARWRRSADLLADLRALPLGDAVTRGRWSGLPR